MSEAPLLPRALRLSETVREKSVFLFGPRQTGKTTLLRSLFPGSVRFDLLKADTFRRLSVRPETLREEILALGPKARRQPVIIDEVQKLPSLLDEAHALIEEQKIRFVLTGSSARKLRRGGANLLAGRATTRRMHPLVWPEIPKPDLNRLMNFGSLPVPYLSDSPEEFLRDYVGTYLKEEIAAEGLVRKIEGFSRFLEVAALSSCELINYASVANDAQVPPRTVIEYFKILEDTLFGFVLDPFTRTRKRKAIATGKFYFFDLGVTNELCGRVGIRPRTELFGKAFEQWIHAELRAWSSYNDPQERHPLRFWRSTSNLEVDFLLGDRAAIEVKGTETVSDRHLGGLRALGEEVGFKRRIVVSLVKQARRVDGIEILPYDQFLDELWGGGIV